MIFYKEEIEATPKGWILNLVRLPLSK